MGGGLTVESKLGEGTVFHLRFPDVPVSGRLPVGDHAEPGGAVDFNDFAPATLLVVDDNPPIGPTWLASLRRPITRSLLPTTVSKRWTCLAKARPDVVLLDIRMPVMDGRTALVEIRKQASLVSLPVIAVTASSKAGEERELQSEFSGYIRKPFSRQTLFAELAQFLQRTSPGTALEGQNLAQTLNSLPIPSPGQAAQWQDTRARTAAPGSSRMAHAARQPGG